MVCSPARDLELRVHPSADAADVSVEVIFDLLREYVLAVLRREHDVQENLRKRGGHPRMVTPSTLSGCREHRPSPGGVAPSCGLCSTPGYVGPALRAGD